MLNHLIGGRRSEQYFLALFLVTCSIWTSALKGQESTSSSDQVRSSYLILPSAHGPEKGQLWIENIDLGYFGADYGFNKNFSIKGSFELFNPLFSSEAPTLSIQPKLHFPLSQKVHIAADFINVIAFDGDYISIPHGVITVGDNSKNVSLGYGHIFYNFFSVDEEFDGISLSGEYRINDRWSVITDNWVLFNEPERSFANRFNFHSLGLSKKVKDAYYLEFGLTYFTELEDFGRYPWPFIKFRADRDVFFPFLKKGAKVKAAQPKRVTEVKKKDRKKKTIYGEFLGVGYIYSLNYDVRFTSTSKGNGPGMRIGVSNFGATYFPIQVNYLIGGQRHFLELASGVTLATSNYSINNGTYGSFNVSPSSSIGYRFQPVNNGVFIRLSADIFYSFSIDQDGFMPWGGLGIGYSFR